MGTTIRREPVTTSIPAAPDYRFLNITNFGGIEKSSNPFVVSSNTASDCLNVYVDEDNALSTRPRLNFIQNLIIAAMDTDSEFNENSEIMVKASNSSQKICLSTDGDKSLELNSNFEIVIRQSKYYAEFIRIKSDEFFDILINKLT